MTGADGSNNDGLGAGMRSESSQSGVAAANEPSERRQSNDDLAPLVLCLSRCREASRARARAADIYFAAGKISIDEAAAA